MGNPLFGVDISGLVNKFVAPGLLDATLVKVSPGTRTAGHLSAGTNPTSASYACKGCIVSKGVREFPGTLTSDGVVTILLVGDSIASGAVPELNDRITIESTTYQIDKLDRDPAAATYTLVCAKR